MDEKHHGWEIFEKVSKIFDENSIEKLNCYLFLGKVVPKNRAFGNSIIFLQQSFRFGSPNPMRTPLAHGEDFSYESISCSKTSETIHFSNAKSVEKAKIYLARVSRKFEEIHCFGRQYTIWPRSGALSLTSEKIICLINETYTMI